MVNLKLTRWRLKSHYVVFRGRITPEMEVLCIDFGQKQHYHAFQIQNISTTHLSALTIPSLKTHMHSIRKLILQKLYMSIGWLRKSLM